MLTSYSFSTFDKIVDVGGGDGSFIVAILQANPKLKGVLFDLPHVTEKAKQRIATAGVERRCEVVAGDAFASVPSGGDAYILSRVINSFNNQRAVAVLKNCRRAMSDKSKLILVERVVPNRVEHSIAAQGPVISDLNMMALSGGRERTAAEHQDVLETAGFTLKEIIPTQSEVSVIEGEPT